MWQTVIHYLVRSRFDGGVVKRVSVIMSDRTDDHGQVLEDLHAEELDKAMCERR